MTRLVLVRHAEADGGESADPGLSDAGREQARALAARLRGIGTTPVRHGPRRRAVETGRMLAEALAVAAIADQRLDDRTPVPSVHRRSEYPPSMLERLDSVPEDERDEDGTALAVAWHELASESAGTTVVLVTHAFVVASFVATALAMPSAGWLRLPVSNTGVTVLEQDPVRGARLLAFDDVAHLGGDVLS